MIVVSDAGPLNYLVLTDCVHVLAALYARVIVPRAVLRELQHPDAPEAIMLWLAQLPDWIEIRDVHRPDPAFAALDRGEQETIALAVETGADGLLIGAKRGRKAAELRSISVTGTLGNLEAAAHQDLLDLEVAVQKLQKTSFRASEHLIAAVLKRHRAGGRPE